MVLIESRHTAAGLDFASRRPLLGPREEIGTEKIEEKRIQEDIVEVYRTRNYSSDPILIQVEDFFAQIRFAAYRFWLSERRLPVALIVCELLALEVFGEGFEISRGLKTHGLFQIDDQASVVILGRPGDLDPLFQFI